MAKRKQAEALALKQARTPRVDPAVMTAANKAGALEAISNYLQADGWEAKLQFIRHPESLSNTIKDWYSVPEHSDVSRELGDPLFFKQQIDDGKVIVLVAAQVQPEGNVQFFGTEKTSSGEFLVDWEVSEAYQEMPIEMFKLVRPTDAKEFRLKIQRDDSYSGTFPETDYASFRLTYPNMNDFSLIGYVPRDSDIEANLESVTGYGQNQPVIVNILYPPSSNDPSRVLISELKHSSWFR